MAKFNMGKLNKYLADKGFNGKMNSGSEGLLIFNYKTYVDRLTELEEALVEYAKANGYPKARRCFNGVTLAKNEIILLTVMERVNVFSIMYADLMANAKKSKQSVMQPVTLSTFSKQEKKKASDWAEAEEEDNIDYTARRKHTEKKTSGKTSSAEHAQVVYRYGSNAMIIKVAEYQYNYVIDGVCVTKRVGASKKLLEKLVEHDVKAGEHQKLLDIQTEMRRMKAKTFGEASFAEHKEYATYQAWKRAVKKLDPKASFTGDKDIDSAFKKDMYDADWDGDRGEIRLMNAQASEKTSFAEHKDVDSSNKSLTDSDYYKLISQDTTHDEVKKFIRNLNKEDLQKLFKRANEDRLKKDNLSRVLIIARERLEDLIFSGSQSVLELDDNVDTMSSEQANTKEATAKNILQKIGGYKKLTKLLGANNLIPHSDGISFKINSEVANYVKITLNAKANNYDIVYRKIKNKIIEDVALTKGLKITQILDDIKNVASLV